MSEDSGALDTGEEIAAHECNQRLGRYRLCFEVAHGGMATVYLARADGPGGFGKLVALKRIHPHLARERAFVDMFLDEARIASMLSHPNACGVTDFGHADDTYFLTMEYLVGESLGQVHHKLAQRQRLGLIAELVPIACRIVADACEGLHSAHELKGPHGGSLNLVHRDISPHNLFVTFEGSVKVVDFGIASAAGRLHHTKAGSVKGKFPYMAPEMLEGRGIDRRADVWALGVVLWETIAVRRLFRQQSDSETLLAVIQKPIPRLSELRADVPPELDRIVEKALARRTEERYATARELGQDLSRFLATRREAVTMLDVAQFMHRLFPDGYAKKQQLLQIAMQVDDGVIPSVSQGRGDATSTLSFRSVSASLSRVMDGRRRVLPVALFLAVFALAALVTAMFWARDEPARETTRSRPTPAKMDSDSNHTSVPATILFDHDNAGPAMTPTVPPTLGARPATDTFGVALPIPPASTQSAGAKATRTRGKVTAPARGPVKPRTDRIYRRD